MWGRAPRKRQVAVVVVVVARAADAVGGGKYADDVDGGDAEDFRRTATQSTRLCGFVCGIGGGRRSGLVVVKERKSRTTAAAEIAARRGEGCPQRVCAMGPGTCDSPSGYYSAASAPWSPFCSSLLVYDSSLCKAVRRKN